MRAYRVRIETIILVDEYEGDPKIQWDIEAIYERIKDQREIGICENIKFDKLEVKA